MWCHQKSRSTFLIKLRLYLSSIVHIALVVQGFFHLLPWWLIDLYKQNLMILSTKIIFFQSLIHREVKSFYCYAIGYCWLLYCNSNCNWIASKGFYQEGNLKMSLLIKNGYYIVPNPLSTLALVIGERLSSLNTQLLPSHIVPKSRNIIGQNRSPILWYIVLMMQ